MRYIQLKPEMGTATILVISFQTYVYSNLIVGAISRWKPYERNRYTKFAFSLQKNKTGSL